MKIPEAAIEAALNGHPESWRETIEASLQAALPALREQWEREQLEAMRSDAVIKQIAHIVSAGMRSRHHQLDIACSIASYLTSPQLKETLDAQD
jgi:CO/xanthine dehydrogenase Mo-binding subunit